MKKRKISWFVKYLLGYLLLAVILLVSVGLPVISNIRGIVEEEIMGTTEDALESVVSLFDGWRQTMEEYGQQIRKDPQMTPHTLNSDGYAVYQAVSELKNMVVYGGVYDRIVIVYDEKYFDALPRVFSSSECCSGQEFFSWHYRYDQWSLEDVYDDMHEIVQSVLRAPEWVTKNRTSRQKYLTYIVPLCTTSRTNQRGMLCFLVPEESFLKMIGQVNIPSEATFVMLDSEGRVVLSEGDAVFPEEYVFPKNPSAGLQAIGGVGYHVLQETSGDGAWRFALLMPEAAMTRAMSHRIRTIVLILVLGMLVAIGASLALSAMIFSPVRRLSGLTRALEHDAGDSRNEFELIERTMRGLQQTNQDLLSRLNSQRSSLRQHMLQAMCLGRMDYRESFLTLVCEEGICFDEKQLRVIVLQMDNEEQVSLRMDSSMRALTRFGLLKILKETVKGYRISSIGFENDMDTRVVALLSGSVADDGHLFGALRQVQQVTDEHLKLSLTVGVSDPFSGLEQISGEYRKAIEAVEMRFIEGCGRIFRAVRFPNALADEETRRQFMRLEVRLVSALKKERYAESVAALEQYVRLVREMRLSPAEARQQLTVLRSSISQQLSMQGVEPHAMEWLGSRQWETMDCWQDALAAALCELEGSGASPEVQRSELVERCVSYMNERLSDAALTMENLADAMGVSSGHLSRCFKAQMGVSPWQYLDGLRLRAACSLLKDTSLHISEILAACGYVDKTNFMRKFKRQYGMTPMEYRQTSSVPEEEDELVEEEEMEQSREEE